MHIVFEETTARAVAKELTKAGHDELARKVVRALDRYGSDAAQVRTTAFTDDQMTIAKKAAKAAGDTSVQRQISSYQNLMGDKASKKFSNQNFKFMPDVIREWINEGFIRGWLFEQKYDDPMRPWLVTNARYTPADRQHDRPQEVTVYMEANRETEDRGRHGNGRWVTFHPDDVNGKTVAEVFADNKFFHETADDIAEYETHIEKFARLRKMHGAQFLARNRVLVHGRWGHTIDKFAGSIKVVNDDDLMTRSIVDRATVEWHEDDGEDMADVPFHTYLRCFALDRHEAVNVHVANLEVYEYDTAIRDQLVLPSDQTDLIDILVNDVDVMAQADIIDGKSEGTLIVCRGEPGLGKTLTAEVYSEAIERPLYKIPAGLLGTKADDVEENLKEVLGRAARWGAIPLIDEADVYIRARGDDLHHNAVVAVWLRVTEYAHGILFVTTNRGDDIDDAIMSRAAAIITYRTPSGDDALRIWQLHTSRLLGDRMPDGLCDDLASAFTGASGRDIQRVTSLVARVCAARDATPDIDTFRQCAVFKGLRWTDGAD